MEVGLIQVPYDSGAYNKRMGRGPFFLVEHGIADTIGAFSHAVESVVVESDDIFPTEVGTTFRLLRATAQEVRGTVERGAFPLVLAGNCITTVGALSGLTPRDVGLIWFDAHGDFHTPETSPSGFLDAMAISIGVGHCWRTLAASIPHFEALTEDRVLLVGARDFEPLEYQRLLSSDVAYLPCDRLMAEDPGALHEMLTALAERADEVYIHLDLDVHDPTIAPANQYRPPGGLTPDQVRKVIRAIASRFPVCGATLAAYDPGVDDELKGLKAAKGTVALLCALLAEQTRSPARGDLGAGVSDPTGEWRTDEGRCGDHGT